MSPKPKKLDLASQIDKNYSNAATWGDGWQDAHDHVNRVFEGATWASRACLQWLRDFVVYS